MDYHLGILPKQRVHLEPRGLTIFKVDIGLTSTFKVVPQMLSMTPDILYQRMQKCRISCIYLTIFRRGER